MQLDHTRIAIRERSLLNLYDMALRVVATHGGALLAAWACGVLPALLLNRWLLGAALEEVVLSDEADATFSYVIGLLYLVIWELPLATAPITLYLGQAMFDQRPRPRVLLGQFLRAVPQLVWYQVLWRPLWFLLPFGFLYPFVARAYLNEVILLERNPLWSRGGKTMTTRARAAGLHAFMWGELFLQWVMVLILGSLLFFSVLGSAYLLRGELLGEWGFDRTLLEILLPVSLWLVIGYFCVVRFLAYLDLRIRREGWELELLVRAEADRLMRHLA